MFLTQEQAEGMANTLTILREENMQLELRLETVIIENEVLKNSLINAEMNLEVIMDKTIYNNRIITDKDQAIETLKTCRFHIEESIKNLGGIT